MRLAIAAAALLAAAAPPARAEVTAFEPLGPAAVAFGGREFAAGRYERIAGRATVALDPANPRNAGIADLSLAPRNAAGKVEATADVVVLRPADPARGNRALLVEAPNRGRELVGQLLHDSPAANGLAQGTEAGNGFLLDRGYTLAWVGWQADHTAEGGLRLRAPAVPGVTGLSREEFLFDHDRSPVEARLTYPAATEEGATLSVRARPGDERRHPDSLRLRFLAPDRVEIARPPAAAGFDAGALYELVYAARDPVVAGMGFAAVRDVAAFLRAGGGGTAAVDRAILHGISQSGRLVRDFLHQGFNEDEGGGARPVFDAMLPHIPGARRTFTNARFAQPGRNPTAHGDRLYPANQFPFAYEETTDHLTGRTDGLLRRCRETRTCPKIIQADSEYEFFGAHASLTATDTRGGPLPPPPEVRAFLVSGHPHFAPANAAPERRPDCALPTNPLHAGAPLRALLVALEAWARDGAAPPDSRFPTAGGENGGAAGLLPPGAGLYPAIPGLPWRGAHAAAELVDDSTVPPAARGTYPVLLPRADTDGNAAVGLRLPVLEAPRATYLGWNPRAENFAPGAPCTNTGSVLPFAATRAERLAANDPRASIEERYPGAADYAEEVRAAAEALVKDRLLLPADAEAMARAAAANTLARLPR